MSATPRLLPLLCALVALGASPAAASAATKGPPLRGLQLMQIVEETPPEEIDFQLDTAKRAGANVVRLTADWSLLEPEGAGLRDAGYQAAVDHTVNGAAARGMKVMFTMVGTPCWASAAPEDVRGDCGSDLARSKASMYPPADPATFATIAEFASARWGARMAGFEVWNEPDQANQLYFAGPDKVRRYVQLLKAAYPAIKRGNRQVQVLGGAFVGKDGRFLQALYANGIKGSYDVLSVHFYDLVLDALKDVRVVQRRNGDKTPLWLAEFGWTSCYPRIKFQEGHNCVTRGVQATNLLDTFRALQRVSYVRGAIVYAIRDTSQYDFGIVDQGGKAKPVLNVLRKALSSRPGRVRRIALKLTRKGGKVVATGSGPAGGAYELDVFKANALRYRVAFRTDRNNRFSVVLPPQLGTRGLTVQVFQYFMRRPVVRRI